MSSFFRNTACHGRTLGPCPSRSALAFHRRLPGYEPTPLVRLPELAGELGLGEVLVKDESRRLGLSAFKVLGGSWAAYRAAERALGRDLEPWSDVGQLRAKLSALGPAVLTAATSGNHGRGVARIARLLGFEARIYVPAGTVAARIDALEAEGAQVVVHGTYEQAVERARQEVDGRTLLIQDNGALEGEEMVDWVVEGYATLFWELEDELSDTGARPFDLVVLPIGAGALASAGIAHFRRPGAPPVRLVGVEPVPSACALAALRAGRVVEIPGPQDSIMAGLNCARVAASAFPLLRDGLDGIVPIDDQACREAMRVLARHGIAAGECGAAGLAALRTLLSEEAGAELPAASGLDAEARVLLLCTEGITDPGGYPGNAETSP